MTITHAPQKRHSPIANAVLGYFMIGVPTAVILSFFVTSHTSTTIGGLAGLAGAVWGARRARRGPHA